MMEPAIIIVHGSWHTPAHYSKLISSIKAKGFKTVTCPRLASATEILPLPPTATLEQDTQIIKREISLLADKGHPILLLMHSYGGVVGGNSLSGLLWPQRQSAGKPGGVVHIIYTASFVIPAETSLSAPFPDGKIPWIKEDSQTGLMHMLDPRNSFYNDVKDEVEAQKLLDMCVYCPTSCIKDKTEYVPYEFVGRGLDATYLVCEGDLRTTKEIQEGMAESLGEGRRMVYCDAGHSPMVTYAEGLARVVGEAWEGSQKRIKSE